MKNDRVTSRRRVRSTPRAGFTLLELMLALALTAVVLVLMNMAIDLHLRSLDARRTQLEESLLARSVLRIIADDIRGVVQSYQQDVSGVEAMIQQAATSATAQLAGAASAATSESSSGTTSTSSSNNQSSSNQSPSNQSASSGGGSTTSQQSSSGTTSSRSSGTSGGSGSPSSGTTSSSANTSGTSTTMSSSSGSSGSTGSSTESQATEDLSAVTVPELPGVYGNQYQLQIDVSRLPRLEEYQTNLSENPLTEVIDIPSDVKTVTYYVQTPPAVSAATAIANSGTLASLTDPNANPSGLVRRQLDRAVTSSAVNTGNMTGLENSGEILAPEVTGIEFRYFDGTEWRVEWDTSTEQTLPIAIQILMSVATKGNAAKTSATATGALPNTRIYSLVVNLPTGGQSSSSSSESSTGTESSSTTSAEGSR
jgi:prepilin-type N-terminal cleavage/methylation domain-containing protein